MILPEHLEIKHIILILIALVFILKRVYASKSFVVKNNLLISTFLIVALAIFIAIEFWIDQQWFGIVALVFAGAALTKAALDMFRKK